MEDKAQQWKRIADKLQQVLQRYQALEKENEHLEKELRLLKEKEAGQVKKIEQLEMKIGALQTATGHLDEAERKAVDKRLGRYIREIDRCIAMLSE